MPLCICGGLATLNSPAPTKRLLQLPVLYAAFAALATATNIAAQDITIRLVEFSFEVPLSILVGTVVGLVVKYMLDKHYIFSFVPRSRLHDVRTFLLYSVMGLFTTVIFWGVELTFHLVFGTASMRYLGGAIGLAIGYTAKYNLDRRFVFE